MRRKTQHVKRNRAVPDTDTATYEQPQGTEVPRAAPNRPRAKMPHERDESARSAGNRLDEALPPSGRQISQAHEDIERGLIDTDRRGIPDDVPSSKRNRGR